MGKLAKLEIIDLPKIYLVGKETRFNIETHIKSHNCIPAFWDKCLADGTFSVLEKQPEYIYEPAYVGSAIDKIQVGGLFHIFVGCYSRKE